MPRRFCASWRASWEPVYDSRMFKKAAQQGRSERKVEAYSLVYVETLSDTRTKLGDFFNILLGWKP
jgi:hypothetical protein